MIIFDQLRISDDGSKLFIDVHVNKADYFKDNHYRLSSITVTTAEHVPESFSLTSVTDFIYKKDFNYEDEVTEANLMIEKSDLIRAWDNYNPDSPIGDRVIDPDLPYASITYPGSSFSGPLFFVWVECIGNYSECTPCFADEPTLGVTFDAKLLYQQAMGYTKELADDCTISDGFIDFILNYSAFKSAIETDHYCDAKTFYNQMLDIKNNPKRIAGRGCGCHG